MAGQDDICCLWRTQTLIFKFRILVQGGGQKEGRMIFKLHFYKQLSLLILTHNLILSS